MYRETGRDEFEAKLIEEVQRGNTIVPRKLVAQMKSSEFPEDRVRAVIWALIDQNRLRVNDDWALEIPGK
jgi:hypothetical protein